MAGEAQAHAPEEEGPKDLERAGRRIVREYEAEQPTKPQPH
jgi:hypothetical protein